MMEYNDKIHRWSRLIFKRLFFAFLEEMMKKILKVLFSRYTVCAVFILAEIILLAFLAFYAYAYSIIFVLDRKSVV